jgi:hypothetical protein
MSPVDIARKIVEISFAVPGTERKRTKLKAPATAIPAPSCPFTMMITTLTMAGRSEIVMKNELV